jgi:hypothetical protein
MFRENFPSSRKTVYYGHHDEQADYMAAEIIP